jgi:O-antigen/teichoic acid export membrane protein
VGNLKKLAGHTLIYGLSTLLARFINYLMNPIYTTVFEPSVYGIYGEFYIYIPILLTILTFGLETGFFRFSSNKIENKESVYSTAFTTLLLTSSVFILYVMFSYQNIISGLDLSPNRWYVILSGWIVFFDVIAAIPFARLRSENKATLFVVIKTLNILINVGLNLLLIYVIPSLFPLLPKMGILVIFIANVITSFLTLFVVMHFAGIPSVRLNKPLFKEMMIYSLPLVISGLVGQINDLLDRFSIKYLLPSGENPMYQMGIYISNLKLAVVLTLFTQMFRYAAEPFFFSNVNKEDSSKTYADVFKYFSIFGMIIFLLVTLYIDIFQYLEGFKFRVGLPIVPILLLSYYFVGLFYNLQLIFKLHNKTRKTIDVTAFGLIVLVIFNVIFVPRFGYQAAAWGRLLSFVSMCVISYFIARKFVKIPYDFKNISFYFVLGLGIYFLSEAFRQENMLLRLAINTVLFGSYVLVFLYREKINPVALTKSLLKWKSK